MTAFPATPLPPASAAVRRAGPGRAALAALLAVGLALVVAGLVPWPASSLLARHVQNAMHPIGFAAAALVLIVAVGGVAAPARRAWSTVAALGTGLLALGGAIELVQARVGRTASLADLGADAAGIVCGLLAFAGVRAFRSDAPVRAAGLSLGAIALLGAGLYPYLPYFVATATRPAPPVVEDFTGAFALERVGVSAHSGVRLVSNDSTSGRGLELTFGDERWPAVWLSDPLPDWRCASALIVDLSNPGTTPLDVTLRVHDASHDNRTKDRFRRRLHVPPGGASVTIAMADIASMGQAAPARRMDLARVSGVMLFGSRELAGRALQIDALRLKPAANCADGGRAS